MLSPAFRTSLLAAIARLREAGSAFTYWWRDDDAQSASASLTRLLSLTEAAQTPLVLAVIPAGVDRSLAQCMHAFEHVHTWQHGFAHTNHAPEGLKKAELGAHRDLQAALNELRAGREQLEALLGASFSAVLVPPWNRVAAEVIQGLPDVGLGCLSTFGIAPLNGRIQGIPCVNTHVDIIDWRGARGFAGESAVLSQLLAHIDARVEGRANVVEATGLLTHHLVHDDASWHFLEALSAWLGEQADVQALGPEHLFVCA
jgi:hypothetical protein